MAVRIDPKTGRWRVEFQQGGQRVLRRLHKGATKEQARALETSLRTEIFNAKRLGIQPEITLEAAIGQWLTHTLRDKKDQRNPVQNARYLAPFVKGKTLRQAPEAAAEAVRAWSTSGGTAIAATRRVGAGRLDAKSAATINRRLSVLKAAARYAYKQRWINENVSDLISRLREDQGRETYLTVAQVRLLASSAPSAQCKAAIMIAAYTGLRASELLALTASSILRSASLRVAKSKTGKPRVVPVPGPARPFLRALPLELSYWQLDRQWRTTRAKAGITHVHWHDLRHTTASWLINAGVDLYTVGKILGHTSMTTTAKYAHLVQGTLEKAMRKLK